MSWSTPNQAQPQWNHVQGMGMGMQDSSSYTPEQWAMMQQQNWHQWTQWQQQYSQWHNQYGDKYAEQLQAVQSMGGFPPPPPSGAAPPPPPDKPPPPPPHENNQPLFNKAQPSTNPVPSQRNTNIPNTNSGTGKNQWSHIDTQPAVNAEALKKLAEEERLFDIQFQKWEEEIEKWRQENVNHPDKQAYKDYEAKFEACRTQLLERRQQMKAKRANLLNNPVQTGANTGNTSVAPPAPKSSQNSYSSNTQSQNFQNKTYDRQYDSMPSSNNRNNKNIEPQDRYESYHLNMSDSDHSTQGSHKTQGNKSDNSFLPSSSTGKGIPGLDLVPDSIKKPEVIDITDDPSESQKAPDYSTISMGINNILGDEKIMNILSMVRGIKPSQETDLNRKTQPPPNNQGNRNQNFNQPQQFDNRHGHPVQQNKDMNSQYQQGGMYRQDSDQQDGYYDQNGSGQYGGPPPNMRGPQGPRPGGPGGPGMRQPGPGMHQGGGGMRPNGPGTQGGPGMHHSGPGMRPNGPGMQQRGPGMQQGGPRMQQSGTNMQQGGPRMQQSGLNMQQGGPRMQQSGPNMQQGGPRMQQSGPNMQQGGPRMQQSGPNMQQGGPRMQQSGANMQQAGPRMQQSGPNIQQGGPNMPQGGPKMQQSGPNMQQGGLGMQQGGPEMQQGRPGMQQRGPGMQQGGPNMQQKPPSLFQNRIPKPDMLNEQGRPPLRDMSSQQNADFFSGPQRPPPTAPIKWVEEPLFTPSIVVEYEHKSLRLKAREFIEPVHTFDYNHISKDGENKKKDFQHEADEMFTRKPRRPEREYADDRFGRDLFQRDYERKGSRDEFRDMRELRDMRDSRDMMDFRDMREPRDRDVRDMRDMRELRDMRDLPRDIRDVSRDMRDSPRDMRDPSREIRDVSRDMRDSPRDMREPPRDIRDLPRDVRDPLREMRDPTRDMRDPIRDMREPLRDQRDSPRDVRDPPRDMRDPPRDMRDPPRDMRELRDFRGRDEINSRDRPRDDFFDRRRDDRRDADRRHDDRYPRRDDHRDRDYNRDRNGRRDDNRDRRDDRKDDVSNRSSSKDKDSRKRASSHESEVSTTSKKTKNDKDPSPNKHIVMIDDLLEPPGRDMRPEKIVIILRGLPGSGKSYLAKLIRDREAEHGGTARIMSIDDYFMQEGEIEEKDPTTGKTIKKPSLKYEYDASLEDTYINSLKRAFKRSLTDGYFTFLIFDAVNSTLSSYADVWNFARQNGFQVYVCVMDSSDVQTCHKRNIHNRKLEDLEVMAARFFATPAHHIQLDATTLLQSAAITEVQMEDVEEVTMDDIPEAEVESVFTSKWEKMDDANKLARLDGTSKPLRPSHLSMDDYLQLDDWTPNKAKPGKKSVRWADIEERTQQEKMRAIGFVVGQTDWNRMTDPTMGSSALTQTKYIERVKRN